jgi:diguanylate cyclase (GGDEF)-like protein
MVRTRRKAQPDQQPEREGLTGPAGRSAVLRDLERAFEQHPFGYVALFDIDNFIYVNDQFGHRVGDAFLVVVTAMLSAAAAPARTYRAAGDEFVVIGAGLDQTAGQRLHRYVRDSIRFPLTAESRSGNTPPNFVVTMSGGVAAWPDPEYRAATDLLRAADRTMYQDKVATRSQRHS